MMDTYNIHNVLPYLKQVRFSQKRIGLIVLLTGILFLLGSIPLLATAAWSNVEQQASRSNLSARQPVPTLPSKSPAPQTAAASSQGGQIQKLRLPLSSGNSTLPEIALTFDDGPTPSYTPQILAILQQYGVNATFFCIGRQVVAYPELVKQEYQAGNIVGNHSWSHPDLTRLSTSAIYAQLSSTSDAIQAALGVRPTFFRPPYGASSYQVLAQANYLNLTTVLWNDEAKDWMRPGINVIISRILRLAHNGAIILLHDGGGDRSQTVAALPYIITSLRNQGYRLVTVQQMMDHAGHT